MGELRWQSNIPPYQETSIRRGFELAAAYSDKLREGYRYFSNTHKDRVDPLVKSLTQRGLEVFVGDKAFDSTGKLVPEDRTILVKSIKPLD